MVETLVQTARELQILRYTLVATIFLACYEYLINFNNEIRYLWRRHFTFASVLLFLARYLPFMTAVQVYVFVTTSRVDKSNCLDGFQACSWTVFVEFMSTIAVLFTRAYAVWGRSRKLLLFLGLVYLCGSTGSGYALTYYIRDTTFVDLRIGKTGCLILISSNTLWINLTILLFCESLAIGLLLLKLAKHMHSMKGVSLRGGSRRSILQIMAGDGIGYFVLTLMITTANLIVLQRVTSAMRTLLLPMQAALQSILCSRLLIHLYSENDYTDGGRFAQSGIPRSVVEMVPMKFRDARIGTGASGNIPSTIFEISTNNYEEGSFGW